MKTALLSVGAVICIAIMVGFAGAQETITEFYDYHVDDRGHETPFDYEPESLTSGRFSVVDDSGHLVETFDGTSDIDDFFALARLVIDCPTCAIIGGEGGGGLVVDDERYEVLKTQYVASCSDDCDKCYEDAISYRIDLVMLDLWNDACQDEASSIFGRIHSPPSFLWR